MRSTVPIYDVDQVSGLFLAIGMYCHCFMLGADANPANLVVHGKRLIGGDIFSSPFFSPLIRSSALKASDCDALSGHRGGSLS